MMATERAPAVDGRTLRKLRIAAGFGLTTLATRCGVSRSQLSNVEHGRRQLSIDAQRRVAEALGVSLSELRQPYRG